MALHHRIQRLLLLGRRLPAPPPPPRCPPPSVLAPLVAAVAPAHSRYNARALAYGDRYRSAFWAIYLLIALAVLFAIAPLALGWTDVAHPLHAFAPAWVLGEILVIGLVASLYILGHRNDWQGRWLAARTRAELAWYLPIVAPLADLDRPAERANWYACLDHGDAALQPDGELRGLCSDHAPLARELTAGARAEGGFVGEYVRWVVSLLAGQQHYHRRVADRERAVRHRIHGITTALFVLTALAALAHLAWHSNLLTVATIVFPVLGASLHGALAQSESYRLQATSERLQAELGDAAGRVERAWTRDARLQRDAPLGEEVLGALRLILDEHRDWHMLVRPHHLPLG